MFGIWRTMLAIEVVVSHILLVPILGAYAVFSFFVLSGFLMTSIMHNTYGYSPRGMRRYAENRALRLYPNYWFAVIVSLILILIIGQEQTARHFASLVLPATPAEWIQNLTMIFLYAVPSDARVILAPPTWALTVEIIFYVLIGLGISRTRTTTWLWLAASIAYVVVIRSVTLDNRYSYAAIPAGSLPFAVGALTYHYKKPAQDFVALLGRANLALLIAARWLVVVIAIAAFLIMEERAATMIALWINIVLSALIVAALADLNVPGRVAHSDKAVGDFSYPIYLLHMQVGVAASVLLFGARIPQAHGIEGLAVLALTVAITFALALIGTRIIDPAIERQRSRIRQRAIAAHA